MRVFECVCVCVSIRFKMIESRNCSKSVIRITFLCFCHGVNSETVSLPCLCPAALPFAEKFKDHNIAGGLSSFGGQAEGQTQRSKHLAKSYSTKDNMFTPSALLESPVQSKHHYLTHLPVIQSEKFKPPSFKHKTHDVNALKLPKVLVLSSSMFCVFPNLGFFLLDSVRRLKSGDHEGCLVQ